MAELRKSFTSEFRQHIWDSTSLGLFLECPRKYYYTIIDGWTTTEQSVHLWFGSAVHSALEAFEHAKAEGLSHQAAQNVMLDEALASSVDGPQDPQGYKTPKTLARTLTWYTEQFKDDPFKTLILSNGAPAVELSFQVDIPGGYVYAGHLDRVAYLDPEELWVMDHKTTKSALSAWWAAGFDMSVQFTGYTFGAQVSLGPKVKGVQINGMQVQKTQSQFARFTSPRTRERLDEFVGVQLPRWLDEATVMGNDAEDLQDQQLPPEEAYPMNPTACGHYGGCPFLPVCTSSPSSRRRWLHGEFATRKDLWDPAKPRGKK